jgi:NADH dehydrogenase [ubiquinone] 1 alpha subcomplex assembly factor 7
MLLEIIKRQIDKSGPMDIGTFMEVALGHPEHGYYMKQDPFGVLGDFTTAPEISQMFGEMIGAWAADTWMRMGAPPEFILLECGPGRGTLMADILRATRHVEGFHDALRVRMMEMSPVLRGMQKEKLNRVIDIDWVHNIQDIPQSIPIILIANEFLDALPMRQFVRIKDGWAERVVNYKDDCFVFELTPSPFREREDAKRQGEGEIFETSPVRENFIRDVCAFFKNTKGAALFIDYGHAETAFGDTFQAVYKHQYVSPLTHIGDADLTSHVDFGALRRVAEECGVKIQGMAGQGAFLENLGIQARALALIKNADAKQRADIESALHRLTGSDQMGELFKVMAVTHGVDSGVAGF